VAGAAPIPFAAVAQDDIHPERFLYSNLKFVETGFYTHHFHNTHFLANTATIMLE
jgi:hypothetical protein